MTAPRAAAAFLRAGGFLADTVLLAHLLALCGLILWPFGAAEWAGFAIVGGSVAGMLAVFAFLLFGAAAWFWGADDFWRTCHPLNLALAMCAAAGYAVVIYGVLPAAMAAMVLGAAVACIVARLLPHHPRAWIVVCICLLSARYALPWRMSGAAAAGFAVVVFAVWARVNFPSRRAAESRGS